MGGKMWLKPVLLAGLVVVAAAIIAAVPRPSYESAKADDNRSKEPRKIEILSQAISAGRVIIPGGEEIKYEVTAEYTFHNPGTECAIRFDLPTGYFDKSVSTGSIIEVLEDGKRIDFTREPRDAGADVSLASRSGGWRTEFAPDELKTILIKYSLEPDVSNIDGAIRDENGRQLIITRAQNIFYSTIEELVLPAEFDIEWVELTGSLDVEIDIAEDVPRQLIRISPNGYVRDGRRFAWHRDFLIPGEQFRIGIIRIADCLYRVDDAREVIRSLTDESYVGYIEDLTRRERREFLRIARNGIFAKHGFPFGGGEIYKYFSSLSWYEHNSDYSDDLLSGEDKEMVQLFIDAEEQFGRR